MPEYQGEDDKDNGDHNNDDGRQNTQPEPNAAGVLPCGTHEAHLWR
eukprot:CAMPEP_0204584006 /NCGR_PEP_ID=MMETSP0661-20131031/46099_1 /ASSEMBLY_ACC=CAM_ASM_000606 /TAXON_ID=109239 /ORGANISM="Alexandrium margalefi, Strain AMGDE01CS-322" /LENGTH=45 /DNA_ID= /DNA_START= /DNA_END= /DNA_ORIENTATION=